MTRPQPLKLGPFTGGMNIASDPASLADGELVDCVNYELDLDGSLVSRPGISETVDNSATWTKRIVMIGRAVLAGGTYVIGSNSDGTYAFNGTTWTTIKAGLQSRIALQYGDNVYIIATAGSAQDGGYWTGAAWTANATQPRGESAVFHKTRMWVVPGIGQTGPAAHQLRYSDIIPVGAGALTWSASNNIPVSQGDGEKLVDIAIHNDNIMLFKQSSTYVLAYDVSVADGVLRKVNNNIGASTYRCVAQFESSIFVYNEGVVYEIQNYDFRSINDKVPFNAIDATPGDAESIFICVVGTRLLVRYFDYVFVYGLVTKTWSRWDSANASLRSFGPWVEYPSQVAQFNFPRFYAGSVTTANEHVFMFIDGYSEDVSEFTAGPVYYDITCSITTKNYDFGDPMHFKKLKWWGLDGLSVNDVRAVASPVILSFRTTWADLHSHTWDSLSTGTWDLPLPIIADVVDDVHDTSIYLRKFFKFLKALRFRQIHFHIEMKTDGSTTEGPCRLFSLTAIVGVKETVVAKVS